MLNKTSILALPLLLLWGHSRSEEGGIGLEPPRAMASWEFGEIEDFDNFGNQGVAEIRNKQLISHSAVWLLQEARLAENARAFLGVGGIYFFIPASPSNNYSFGQRAAFALTDAHGEFDFWRRDGGDHGLRLKAGVFPFKYNEDAKNLGEYMFRTYTYPTVIFTGGLVLLNGAGVQINGVDANTRLGGLNNDLMLTVKTDQAPSGSLSLTDLVSYSFGNYLTVGAGYMFDNVYDPTNLARGNFDPDKRANYYELKNGTVVYDSAGLTDSIRSMGHYTFVGQKAMIRASLDLGNVLSSFSPNRFLGDKQLRVYFEAVVMGLKDYPGYYDTLENRIAYMAGVNLPTFGILSLLSLEMEYCRNPYPNNTYNVLLKLTPTPETGWTGTGDDLKWTVYARKEVFKGFSITAQAARDHLRLVDFFGHYYDQTIMQHPDNWYWAFQLSYSI